ncbi:MAG: hypothetical protein K6B44_12175 [Lachnospiraceae bacterium]|nr:hypothetical protein [Lachnospiraceae bacterium]
MILKKIHVDSFGKLQDYDLELKRGLNGILHENGWGKSTLMSFIRVMFYGFDNEKKRSEIENERRKFTPWLKGNAYGGYIVIEVKGKNYRVERFFDKGGDVFRLYDADTGLVSQDYSEKIGEELFGIDRDSFSKTVFVAQQACRTEVTSEISAKIGNVSEELADMAKFEAACETLHNEQNRLSGRRATGLISKLKNEVAQLKIKTDQQQALEASLDQINAELEVLNRSVSEEKETLEKLHSERDELSSYNALLAERKEYDALADEKKNAERECADARALLGEKIPEIKTLDEIMAAITRLKEMKSNLEAEKTGEEEEAEYNKLRGVFEDSVPGEKDLNILKEKIEEIRSLHDEMAASGFSGDEKRRYEELKERFKEGCPDPAETEECLEKWKTRESLNNMLPMYRSNEAAMALRLRSDAEARRTERENEKKKEIEKKKKNAGLITAAGVIAVIGAVAVYLLLRQTIGAVILLAAGLAVTAAGIYLLTRKYEYRESGLENWEAAPELIKLREEIEETERRAADTERLVKELLQKNLISYREENVQNILYDLRRDIEEYGRFEEREGRQREKLIEKEEKAGKLSKEVRIFLERFGIVPEELSTDSYYELQDMIQRFMRLDKKAEKDEAAAKRVEEEEKKVEGFLKEYELQDRADTAQLGIVRENVSAYENKKSELERRSRALRLYEEEHDVSRFEGMEKPEGRLTAEELTKEITDLEEKLEAEKKKQDNYLERAGEIEEQLEEISENSEKLLQKETEKKEAEYRFDVISKTENMLRTAKENFLKRYLAPMQDGFDRYYTMLSGDPTDVYDLDVNFNVMKREQGQLRDTGLLSEGYKDMVGLCRRMAMIDAMYGQEAPFLVFDDPFVNLDDTKTGYGLEFLKKVADKYQVIYTTCHSGRAAETASE